MKLLLRVACIDVSSTLKDLAASLLHWRAGSLRSFTALRKEAGLFSGSFLRKGVSLSQVGSLLNLKDLKDLGR